MHAEQSGDEQRVDIAVAAAQQAAGMRAAESRAQAAMMVEAVEDRAYEVSVCFGTLTLLCIPKTNAEQL